MQTVITIWGLPDQIRTELSQIDGLDAKPYISVVGEAEVAMAYLGLEDQGALFVKRITPDLKRSLQMISALLRKDVPRHSLSKDNQVEILASIAALEKEIRQAEFDRDFTDFALTSLHKLSYAISMYDVVGSKEVILRVDELFGGLLRQTPSIQQSDSKKSIAKRLYFAGTAVLLALNIGNQSVKLEQSIQRLLDAQDTTSQVLNAPLIEPANSDLADSNIA